MKDIPESYGRNSSVTETSNKTQVNEEYKEFIEKTIYYKDVNSPKLIYRFGAIPVEMPTEHPVELIN